MKITVKVEVEGKQFSRENVRGERAPENNERMLACVCVFALDLCRRCNSSALNRAYCCPCKLRAMSFSFKMRLITGALLYEFN